jgi:CBS domain-containing protein
MTETVNDFMRKSLITIEESASVQEAANRMKDKNVSSLVVIEANNNKPLGLITERDLVRKVCIQDVSTSKLIIKEIMSFPLITIDSNSSASEAADMMLRNNVRHLLVVDSKSSEGLDKPIGIVTPLDFTKSEGYAGSDDNDTVEKLLEYYI